MENLEGRCLLTGVVFADAFGTTGAVVNVQSAKTDASGNSYITGTFSGTVGFGATTLTSKGFFDIFVAKLDPLGNVVWADRMGSSNPTTGDVGRSLALDPTGNVYVTGAFTGTSDFGATMLTSVGSRNIFVEKLSNSGAVIWAKGFGGTGDSLGQSIVADSTGNVYVTGNFTGSATFGSKTLTSGGGYDVFVTKLDASGNSSWADSFGGTGEDDGFGIALDSLNNVYFTGIFSNTANFAGTTLTSAGDSDIYVASVNNSGTLRWAKRMGGTGHDDGVSIAIDSGDHVYVTGDFSATANFGTFNLTSPGNNDVFVERLDSAGNVVWAKGFGGPGGDAGFGVTTDGPGNVYVTGTFQGTANFGGIPLSSVGGNDVFFFELDPAGNVLLAQGFGSSNNDQAFGIDVNSTTKNITLVGAYGGPVNLGTYALPFGGSGYAIQYTPNPAATHSPPPSDFLSLGHSQLAVFRTGSAQWFALGNNGGQQVGFIGANHLQDIPVAGDYTGIGHTEPAVFRVATADWYAQTPSGNQFLGHFGATNLFDIPVMGDFTGSGHSQLAVFRPSSAQWFVMGPTGGQFLGTFGARNLFDIPVPGDYDGTGHTELAVFRPSTAEWYVLGPNGGRLMATFGGINGLDVPVPGDYDGVGHTQIAVFRPSTGAWYVLRPTGGVFVGTFGGHNLSDIPTETTAGALVKLGFVPRSFAAFRAFSVSTADSLFATAGTTTTATVSAAAAPAVKATTSAAPRASVVTKQGSVPKDKTLWSSAIDELYGLGVAS